MAIKLTVMPLDMDPNSKPTIKIFNKEELTLGRLPSNDIVLNRPEVSGIHARLRVEHDEFGEVSKLYITDLGSSNGTLVEKNPLKARVEVPMMLNERIFIGSYVIKPSAEVEEDHDSHTTIEAPSKYKEDDFQFAAKTQEFDNVMFKAVEPEYEEEEQREEVREVVNSSPKNISAFSSIMFGSEPEAEEPVRENDTSVLRSMYASPSQESFREPESRISPFGRIPEVEDEEEYSEEPPREEKTVQQARPTWAQVKEDFLEEKEVTPKEPEPVVVPEAPLPTASAKLVDRFSIRVKAGDESEKAIKVQAKAYTKVSGKVMNKGFPLSGVTVRSDSLGHTTTDQNGYYEFSRVLEDSPYKLSFSKDKYLIEPNTVQGSATFQGPELLSQATKLCSIKGVVSHNGAPLEGVEVDAGELGKRVTGADGSYQFDNVPEGMEYDLVLYKEGYAFQG